MTRQICDSHTHTRFSIDSSASLEEMCKEAVSNGMTHIAFTEHYDLHPYGESCGFFKPEQFARAIENARTQFGGQLTILKGIEFGEPHLYQKEFEEAQQQDYDVIIGSIHLIEDGVYVGTEGVLEQYPIEKLYERYFQMMLDTVRFGGFDILAHFDLPKRYWKQSAAMLPVIDEILATLVAEDIALEVNTSSLRKGGWETMPGREVLTRYAELGGTNVTFGSDAHKPQDVGANFDDARALLEEIPQLTSGYFEQRRFIRI